MNEGNGREGKLGHEAHRKTGEREGEFGGREGYMKKKIIIMVKKG